MNIPPEKYISPIRKRMIPARRSLMGLLLGVLALLPLSGRCDTLNITTSNSGVSQIDSADSLTWNFALTSTAPTVTELDFYILVKVGVNVNAPITLSLYDGLGGTGTLLGSVSRSSTDWAKNQVYTERLFTISNITASANNDYSIKLTSATSTGGSSQYFVKYGALETTSDWATFVLSDGGNGTTSTSTSTPTTNLAVTTQTLSDPSAPAPSASPAEVVPEPSTVGLLFLGAATAVVIRRKRVS